MVETNVTRRRVMQGAGAVGVAGVFGSTVVTAQDNETGTEQADDQAALRVVHAVPDAPAVDVRLDGGGGQDGGDGEDGGDGSEIGGLGFREASSYTEVEPGSHRVELVVSDSGLLDGILDDFFGGGDGDDETVIYDEEVELEAGTTYTAVAFGELRQGPVPAEGDETGVGGGNETDLGAGNETDLGADNETEVGGLGDDNESDVGASNETDVGTGNETDVGGESTEGEPVVDQLAFGEHESFELDARDYTLEFREAAAAETDGALTDGGTETDVGGGNETDLGAGNETEVGGLGDDNETDVGASNDTDVGTGNETDVGADTEDTDRGFQVELLEDDLSDPGENRARIRVFHAVPDVDAMSITAVENEGGGLFGGGEGDNETDGAGNETEAGGLGGDNESDVGDDNETEAGGLGGDNETDAGAGNETDAGEDDMVQESDISPEGGAVYSGFALGYFDPEAAAGGNETDAGAGNETDAGGLGGDNESDVGDDNETEAGGLGGDNETDGNATDEEDIVEDPSGEEFEFVTAQDAQNGERSDGSTGGGLF